MEPEERINVKLIALIIAGLFALFVFFLAYTPVKYGTVKVITRFGRATDRILQPGLNWRIPFIEGTLTYRTQKITYEASDHPKESKADYTDFPVDTTTQDGQQIKIRYTVRFSIDGTKASWIANHIGAERAVVERIVKTDTRIHARNTPREFNAIDLYTGNVYEVQARIEERLRPLFKANGLLLDEFGIRSIGFTPEYADTIEQKQIEAEKVITEENIAEQETFKKQARITRAEGLAQEQSLQQQTLTPNLLQKIWIEAWEKGGSQVPSVMCGDQGLIFQLPEGF